MDLFSVLTAETKKKNEDMETVLNNLDKSMVLQRAKIFNESQLSTRNCMEALVKVLCLLYQGNQHLTKAEATELFFATTRLFQSTHLGLRRLVYMVIKELADLADDVIIVTSSLTRDINSKWEPVYRANAIRALCRITDVRVSADRVQDEFAASGRKRNVRAVVGLLLTGCSC
jgi:coatomer protein complex subunit gamma